MRLSCRGFSLIEVMITVLVAGIGLLAVAALQTTSKKLHHDALQRTIAAQLAQDLLQRMRANGAARDLYLSDDALAAPAPGTDCAAADASCDAAALAAFDLYQWGQQLAGAAETDADGEWLGGLAAATGCVSAGSDAGLYVITIAWRGLSPLDALDDAALGADCGDDKAAYDDPGSSGSDLRMRRTLALEAYIANPEGGG